VEGMMDKLIFRPRITDIYGIQKSQAEIDFAIQFLEEDIPLYLDPFLLWKSPSQQDQALHTSITNSFNHLATLTKKGRTNDAIRIMMEISECSEVGLGVSKTRTGKKIGTAMAKKILDLFTSIPLYNSSGFTHFETIQLYVDGISKDRVSDFSCNFLKSFLIDYTIDQCNRFGIKLEKVALPSVYNY
jgi:hypothetical protein